MRKRSRSLALLASSAAVALGLAVAPVTTANASSIRYGGTLHVVMPWGSILHNFNPLVWDGGTGTTAGGTGSLLYEPMFYDNQYTGAITPLLGSAYKWTDGNMKLVVTTRSGVDWSDGTPFSAGDVAFTFNYIKKFPALDAETVWKTPMTSVTATGPDTVVFSFSSPYTAIFPLLAEQPIVPEHIWSKITDPTKFTNPNPVGTGPFLLKSYSAFQVSYVKNPHYWMTGKPYINGVVMTAVKSDTTAELLVLDGDAAYTYDEITDPNKTFVAAHPSWNHYWWPPYELNLLYFNTATTPFNDVALRKAVAEDLNTNAITERAYFGSLPAGNETAVAGGLVSQWVPSSLSSLEWNYSPSEAMKTLTAAGYKIVGGKLMTPSGTPVPTQQVLIGGPGWTDYISIAQTISEELSQIGISSTVVQDTFATYYAALQEGHYTLAVSWNNNNYGSPYYAYYDLLSSTESAAIGSTANTNWERFTSPTIDAALKSYASTASLAVQKADMATIEREVLTNVPVVALTARPNWFDYSTRYYTGWPSASDPYNQGNPPDDYGGGAEMLYLNVHLK
ncbi:MAG TPA: ABC transporter substrate-binding protein [Acidimicrobiales bacterium]|nr:ABC transporter substrate-binding protein [Acidimicrobiales bacterium]